MSAVEKYTAWVLLCWIFASAQEGEGGCNDETLFPAKFQDVMFIGCIDFGEVTWCQLEDGEYTPCPPDFFKLVSQQTSTNEEDVVPLELVPQIEVRNVSLQKIQQQGIAPSDYQEPQVVFGDEAATYLQGDEQFIASGKPVVDVFDNCGREQGPCVQINEIMASNENTLIDGDGDNVDWIEFVNNEDEDISMFGWFLSDNSNRPTKWMFPDVRIPKQGFIVIFASGKNRRVPGFELHTNFRLSSGGEYLALYRPDGRIASAVLPKMPPQYKDVTYGRPNLEKVQPALSDLIGDSNTMSYLSQPTPGLPNAGPLLNGPIFYKVTDSVSPRPSEDEDILITVDLIPNFYPVESAKLVVDINYANQFEIQMDKEENDKFLAIITSDNYNAGDMVRWYVQASDAGTKTSRSPPFTQPDYPEYYGTVVYSPDVRSTLPIFQWFVQDPQAAISTAGSRSALYFNGYLYDNVFTRRRGITALTWPKPKIKFDFKGSVFEYNPDKSKVEEFNLQSFWEEPGEDSYMRETVAFQILQEADVPASDTFYVTLFLNNQFFGLFAFIEQVDDNFLEKWGYSTSGYLYKSSHGEFSNLRWDQKFSDYPFIWRTGNHDNQKNFVHVYNFTQGLAGGGPGSRAEYVMDHVNLPQVVNEMAIQTMFLNQDRCTKNFYIFYDVETLEWYRFPWDMESAFGISSGYQGIPAPDYCILIGEQWNSPLYCNNEHPQDLVCFDPFTGSVVEPDPFKGCANQNCGEELIPPLLNGQLPPGFGIPENYDDDFTQTRDKIGARATYNHLTDAILDIPETREMYLRRLRSVMDQFMLTGRMVQIINETYAKISDLADLDNQYWKTLSTQLDPTWKKNTVHNVHNGYKQLIEEQIPRRAQQLYLTYGPGGQLPFIPDEQPKNPELQIRAVDSESSNSLQHYIEIYNPNDFAVDISYWYLSGSVELTFATGTVIPSDYSIYVTPSVRAFREREKSPKGYERNFVVGPWKGDLPQDGYVLNLHNTADVRVDQKLA